MCHTLCKVLKMQRGPVSCPLAVCKQVGEVAALFHCDTGHPRATHVRLLRGLETLKYELNARRLTEEVYVPLMSSLSYLLYTCFTPVQVAPNTLLSR